MEVELCKLQGEIGKRMERDLDVNAVVNNAECPLVMIPAFSSCAERTWCCCVEEGG